MTWGGIPKRRTFWLDQWDSQEEVRMLTKQLSDFLYEVRYESLPSKAVDNAKLYLEDLLGVAAAGSVQPQGRGNGVSGAATLPPGTDSRRRPPGTADWSGSPANMLPR